MSDNGYPSVKVGQDHLILFIVGIVPLNVIGFPSFSTSLYRAPFILHLPLVAALICLVSMGIALPSVEARLYFHNKMLEFFFFFFFLAD